MAAPSRIGEQMPINALPHFIGHMQTDSLGQVITHPPAGLNMALGRGLNCFAGQPQTLPQRLRISTALTTGSPIGPAPRRRVTLQRPPQPKHRRPLPLQTLTNTCIADVEFQADHRHRTVVLEVRRLGLAPPPRGAPPITTNHSRDVSRRGCHGDHETITRRQRRRGAPIPKPADAHRTNRRSGSHHLPARPTAAAQLLSPTLVAAACQHGSPPSGATPAAGLAAPRTACNPWQWRGDLYVDRKV